MKDLNKKVFITIFSIISTFFIFGIVIYNFQLYKNEYNNIHRNLNFMEREQPIPREFDEANPFPEGPALDNMMIMDYEVYTVIINDGDIERIIGHTDNLTDFEVAEIAEDIIDENNKGIKIGNLYTNKYSYNYRKDNTIVIINTESVNKSLRLLLLESFILFIIIEILIYFASKIITRWITEPAVDAFNKQKDFIADASHELKTPLAVIIASSDELKSDKKNTKYVENIKYESDRMSKLITSLLDLSKLENGVNKENYKDENLSKIIEKIGLTFEGIAFEKNVKIETNIEENIMFKCSKDEMEKLISIILDNAIKHSYKDSSISINVNKEKNNIKIDIINSGDPIEPGTEEKIFERFYRADKSRKRDSNRYGLGLAIAKRIVLNHNGTIRAFSKDNQTTFRVNLKKN